MAEGNQERFSYDFMLLIPTLLLLSIGLVAIFSASSLLAEHKLGDGYFYLKRQATFCLLGLCFMIIVKNAPAYFYARIVYPLLGISFLLLLLLFVPGFGVRVGGACRWIRVAGISLQPSEPAKLALAFYIAYALSKNGANVGSFFRGLMPHLFVAAAFMALIVLQPDLGTTVILGCWLLLILFVAGVSLLHLFSLLLLSVPLLIYLVLKADYRLKRWWAFLNPWDDPQGLGFQIIHSFLAFGSGGILGVGLGNSKQKLFYLPEPHTDFILSIVAEELGLAGFALILVLFGILIVRGIRVALSAPDLYSTYLALSITIFLGLQVLVNMGVVLGLLPTKGLTLPFISYGGSSLLISLIGIGILLNISARR
ncbi:MAG: putative lipid II flippase FtsW [Deltaproteobacteria bacterium]|nr:putative lipid II flippase FtsW [Deltaproteobacteria bacterium]